MTDVGCHVYGIVRSDATLPPGVMGLDEAPVRLVVHGTVAAAVNDIGLDRPPGRRAELMAYHRVLDELARSGPVVPVRFGSVLEDDRSVVEDLLAPDEGYFSEVLDQLAGRSQFNVKASYREGVALAEIVSTDPTVAALREQTRGLPPEAAYADRVRMGELVARDLEDKRAHDAQVLLDAIVVHSAAHRFTMGSGVDDVASFALLVDDDRRPDFEQQLEDLAEAVHERIRLSLVGPVAPYDFAGDV